MFGEIYPFAGAIRDENIAKGSFRFCNANYIPNEADRVFRELRQEHLLIRFSREQLPERLAYYMAEINVLHPFREGNGRVQREFIRTLALANGYDLSWRQVDPEALLQASIKSVTNTNELAKLIHMAIRNTEPDPSLMQSVGFQRTTQNRER